jgi:Ca-activated chloride channel homolog
MRAVTLGLLLSCAVSTSAVAGTWSWSDLWSTPEQQGQRLLDSKQPAAAAPLFKDPRRRGYAESRAGEYSQAAKSLAPLHDTDSLYNRGNALAHTGQLRDALAAYDAALAQSPGNRDVVRNRDLVAKALQDQQHQAGDKGDRGKQGQGNSQSGSQGQSQAGNQGQQGSQGQSQAANQGQQGSQGQSQAANQGQQPGTQGQSQAANQTAGTNQAQGATDSNSTANPTSAAGNATAAADATRAGEARSAIQDRVPPGTEHARAGEALQPPSPPRTEQAIALDQWLRGIPDDSAELLRRKFLIEHMMKQQGNEP